MNGNEDNMYSQAGSNAPQESATPGQGGNAYNYGTAGSAGPAYSGPAADPYGTPGYPPPYGYAAPPPPPPPGAPNPGLAALLGFIPGVGAMYNGQFAKGIAHIVIFAILTSLSKHTGDTLEVIFGLLVAGWYFYMVFDAYQTARARRDGLVVPDPFGLNNIGEKFGLQGNPNWGDFVARPANGTATPAADAARTSNPYAGPTTDPVTGAPVNPAYGSAVPPYAPGPNSYAAPFGYAAPATPYPGAPYAGAADPAAYPPGTVPPPYTAAYGNAYAAPDPNAPLPATRTGLPTGALWLIGLGALFLVGSLGHSFYWSGRIFGAFFLLLLGVGLIVQRTLITRDLYPSGTAAFQWNLLHQNRPGIYLVIVGILQALNNFHVAAWHYTWPYLLIAFGLFQLADRALYNRMLTEGPAHPNGYAPVPEPVPAASPTATQEIAPISGQEVR